MRVLLHDESALNDYTNTPRVKSSQPFRRVVNI
jgi:hypothetical protein